MSNERSDLVAFLYKNCTGRGGHIISAGCLPDDVYLGYTIQDDGVHLFCHRCLWDDNLGFNATVADATHAVAKHCWSTATI